MPDPKVRGKIATLTHWVALCTMEDVVDNNGQMELTRRPVTWLWAEITMQWNLPSFIGRNGYAIQETQDRSTHHISIRAGSGLIVTSAAWVYEERRKSPPRWYKVIGFGEADEYIVLTTHLLEMSDKAQPPTNTLSPRPQGVKL